MSEKKPYSFSGYEKEFGLATQESPAKLEKSEEQLFIGVPKENSFQEKRIALTPESVEILVSHGHRVLIESNAGKGANFTDRDFTEVGAEIAYDAKKVFEADIILKVAPPCKEEIDLLKHNQFLISPLHLPTIQDGFIPALMKKKVTALALEYIKDESGTFPFVRSMSEIAGSTVMLLAAELLSNTHNGAGILLGGISGVPPAKVVVLGAGVVGEFAVNTALGLGANVKVFDNNIYKLMRLQNDVGQRLFTCSLFPNVLAKELETADVVIGAIHSESGRSPLIVTEDMVANMKDGSVIVDVSIDQGGIFETSEVTSHQNPTFTKYGVIHYCVPNIASRVARTSSYAMSNVLTSNLLKAIELGGVEQYLHRDVVSRNGIYIYKGCLTNKHLADRFDLKYTNIDLLFTSGM